VIPPRRLLVLTFRMLRYRVAVMIWLFLLLGLARSGAIEQVDWRLGLAVVVISASYIAATSVNDIADEPIDRINHPGDRQRPLVTGDATRNELWAVHLIGVVVTVAAAVPLGPTALGLAIASVVVGWAYSLPPVQLSHRTFLAPISLSVAYVAVPFALGVELGGGVWSAADVVLGGALLLLFGSRIVLKDFRDRAGDAAYGKATVLLRRGKSFTCAASLGLLAVGNALLVVAVNPPAAVLVLMEGFFVAIGTRLHALWTARQPREEQVAIGLGARMGNGLLLLLTGWLGLSAAGAPEADRVVFAVTLTIVFAASFAYLTARPDRAVVGYKG
jgi:4-hydroxybenzoate polyprenyltransferase